MPTPDMRTATTRGLAFLAHHQESDGSFVSFSSASPERFRRAGTWRTNFVPALMLSTLAELTMPEARQVRRQLAGFLLSQKDENWSFNYWSRRAPEYHTQAYPNDLDDTFCALAGLYKHDSSLIDEAAMAHIIKLLLTTEETVGGPYRTWLVSGSSKPVWLDVDVAVNSNIAYFLSLAGHKLPKLDDFIGQAIMRGTYASPYYPLPYAFMYYFARTYQGAFLTHLRRQTRQLQKTADNDLNRALCLSARLRLGDQRGLEAEIKTLLDGQRPDGSWPAAAFYADPVKDGRLYYSGAAALTTAFVLETLELYQRAQTNVASDQATIKQRLNWQPLLRRARERADKLEPVLRDHLLELLRRQAEGSNGRAIVSLASDFNRSLVEPLRPEPLKLLKNLGLANLYGWLAYTIYDDFLDEEGRPAELPAANVAMRYSLESFGQSLDTPAFQHLVRDTFDVIDGANAWEQAHCRCEVKGDELTLGTLPSYGNLSKLAERSLGHTLPPLAVLVAKGLSTDSTSFQQIDRGLHHYLIVRQLNDDLHDWQEDLQRGHLSYVVTRLLRELKLQKTSHRLAPLTERAQRHFWHQTLTGVCQLMQRNLVLSRQAFQKSGLLTVDCAIYQLLDELESSLAATLNQQRQTVRFLKHYKETVRS